MRGEMLVTGLLAHVDAGKTTLSEAMLFCAGRLRRLGRVDHGDAFLDTDPQERERGITIFSKQAELTWQGVPITLLDTPGHVDFSSEMERTLQVLDAAVLVVSGADGPQGHTRTLWRLLEKYKIPVFIFVNKMDQPGADRAALTAALKRQLSEECVDFLAPDAAEQQATLSERALNCFLETGTVPAEETARLIAARQMFPCFFGSALKMEGVEPLLDALARFAPRPEYPEEFGARVYKIARDAQGARLAYLKITGGRLRVRDGVRHGGPESAEEKVNQIRFYSGAKYRAAEEAAAGCVCAVTGLDSARIGQGLGAEKDAPPPVLTPIFTYQVLLPRGYDPHAALRILRQLEEEDPQLHVVWREQYRELHVQLMGEVQLEVLSRLLRERFQLAAEFGEGSILYRETIENKVEGVGHYEPLRHYAEVHLLLEPGPRGSGLQFSSVCPEDALERSWQRLILTHLAERTHPGVLTGAPITDMKITLAAGRAHLKHTEGGDFRQATYRAVRQGLMQARSVLLEPWYDIQLELPNECVGRAMNDLQQMGGSFSPPTPQGEETLLLGSAPVARARHYAKEVTAYTKGRGHMLCSLRGYEACQEQEKRVAALGYDPERDLENPADSVFCAHGAGFVVKWNQVKNYMHLESCLAPARPGPERSAAPVREAPPHPPKDALEEERELMAIFERAYGPIKPRAFQPLPQTTAEAVQQEIQPPRPEFLLVDGYNILFAWDELKAAARQNLEAARRLLMDILCNYKGVRACEVILVFDAYKVRHNPGTVEKYQNISVVYTKEAETADNYIEKTTYDIGKKYRVRVATSDALEQMIILGHGALRLSAAEFHREVEAAHVEIARIIAQNDARQLPGRAVEKAMRTAWDKRKNG